MRSRRRQQNDTRLGPEVEEDLRSHQQIATENGLQPQTREKRGQGGRRCGGSDINRARAAAEADRDEVQIGFKPANGGMKILMATDRRARPQAATARQSRQRHRYRRLPPLVAH